MGKTAKQIERIRESNQISKRKCGGTGVIKSGKRIKEGVKGREAGKEDSEGGKDRRTIDRRLVGWSGGEREVGRVGWEGRREGGWEGNILLQFLQLAALSC